jgi:hypothetical protein
MHSTVHKILKELSLTVNVAKGRTSHSMPLRKKGSIHMELHLHIPHIPSWINTYAHRQLYLSDLNEI